MRDFVDSPIGHMSMDTYRKIIYHQKYLPKAIKLNWRGEPLLYKYIISMVHIAKNAGVHEVLMNTNGQLLNPQLLFNLSLNKLDWLIISADGATRSTYESIRCGGDFKKLYTNIVNAYIHFNGKIRIQICPQEINQYEIDSGFWRLTYQDYADELRIGKLFNPQGKRDYKVKQPKFCPSLWQRMVVAWNGDIYPCPSAFQEHFKLGNIDTLSIYDAWHSEKMNHYRSDISTYGRSQCYLCKNCSSYC